jgi:hypothetical protein
MTRRVFLPNQSVKGILMNWKILKSQPEIEKEKITTAFLNINLTK